MASKASSQARMAGDENLHESHEVEISVVGKCEDVMMSRPCITFRM